MSSELPAGGPGANGPRPAGALGSTARSSALSFAGALVSSLAGFGLSLVVGRGLGPTGSGVIFQLISVFTIAGALAKLGLDTTAVWLLPRLASSRAVDVRRATRILLGGAFLGGVIAGGVIALSAPFISGGQEQLRTLLWVSATFLPVSSVFAVALAVTRGLGGIRPFVLIGSIGLPTTRLAAVGVVGALAAGTLTIGLAWLAMLLVATVPALYAVRRGTSRFEASSDVSSWRSLIGSIREYSAPRAVSSVIEQALLWLDVLIVGLLAGVEAAGIYGVVSRLIQAGTVPSTSMRIVVAPEFSRMLHRELKAELAELYTRTTQWIILMGVPVYILLSIFSKPVLSTFGAGFEAGWVALCIMCVGAVISASTGNVQSLLLMTGRSGWAAINKVIALCISVALLVVMVPAWGIVGAATAWAITMTVDAGLATIQVARASGTRLDPKAVMLALGCAGVGAAGPALLVALIMGDTLLAAILGGVASLVGWATVVYVMRRPLAVDQGLAAFGRGRGRGRNTSGSN